MSPKFNTAYLEVTSNQRVQPASESNNVPVHKVHDYRGIRSGDYPEEGQSVGVTADVGIRTTVRQSDVRPEICEVE